MLVLALLAAPVAAAVAPSDYDQAVAHRRAGRHAEAVEQFRAVLRTRPDHADAQVGLGLSLWVLGRHAEAEAAFQAALSVAPEYWDAHVGLARLEMARGDHVVARARLARVLASDPAHADAAALARRLDQPPPRGPSTLRADLWAGRSSLSDGLPSWTQAGAVFSAGAREGWSGSAGVEVTERFERRDVYFEAATGHSFRGGGSWRLAVGGAPDADHRAELAVRPSVVLPVAARMTLVADAGWARYPAVEVVSFSPGLEFVAHDRLTLLGRWVAAAPADEDLLSGYAARAVFAATDTLHATLGWADAPESSEGRPVAVETLSLGLAKSLGDRLSVTVTGAHETRPSFTRDEVVVSTAYRF